MVPPPLLILVIFQHLYSVNQLVLGVQQIQIVVVVSHQLLCVLRRELLARRKNKYELGIHGEFIGLCYLVADQVRLRPVHENLLEGLLVILNKVTTLLLPLEVASTPGQWSPGYLSESS